jgi:biotin transport system substrate-specific component
VGGAFPAGACDLIRSVCTPVSNSLIQAKEIDVSNTHVATADAKSSLSSSVLLADRMWPAREGTQGGLLRAVLLIAFGTALLTVSAKVNVPLPLVPMTMQTLVVVMIGVVYGSRLGLATVAAYLVEGAMGFPVFAGPIGGVAYMAGSTGGYLAGFVVAVFVAGLLAERGWARTMPRLFAVMIVAHILIIGGGFAWLAYGIGIGTTKAWAVGVLPFIAGTLVKSALGATLIPAISKVVDGRKD